MPSVALLRVEGSMLRNLALSIASFFRELVDVVVPSDKGEEFKKDEEVNAERKAEDVFTGKKKREIVRETETEVVRETGTEVERETEAENDLELKSSKSAASLFPAKHNVDAMLFGRSSVIPCSLDVDTLDTPMTLSVTPEGNFSCKLNNAPFAPTEDGSNNQSVGDISPVFKNSVLPISPQSNISTTPLKEEEGTMKDEGSAETDKEGNYVCHYCDAKFRIRGYLTRHIKKHAIRKAYHCPFYNSDAPPESRCHNSGGFSRRDTYKTHLKARHFIYPKGVKPQDRNKSSGHCSQCGQYFENTDQWVEQHIETGECKGLPEGYLKNIKSERTSGKLRMIKTSNGHSRFISTAQSVVEPKVLLNKDALEAMAIVAHNTNRSDILSKYGNNKIMMSSDDFNGVPKVKRKYTRRKGILTKNSSANFEKKDTNSGLTRYSDTPRESRASPYESNCPSESMDDETALNEISSSINPSPLDNHVLELVSSDSSESSHEELHHNGLEKNGQAIQPMNISNFTNSVKFNDPFSVPLDMEQCSFFDGSFISYFSNNEELRNVHNHANNDFAANGALRNQINLIAQAENHLRENEQYLSFYNFKQGKDNTLASSDA
ncbi:hypothetical protein HG535_0D05520 [Zygotorulaspora mrakii]|uniref:Transcription factor STP1 n=1 Tax=Zygotorulaspora mrakii TaxID=42260 RepID=A0A7H9B2Y1_ZYGMR|nr:uncharacterized protein HG535_0D05520 [Zygotorulaspora mrakii]QLG72843.1 hypothetical protein HG535_0D05520 [Zygotorulaspora mrakii]